ncbi:MAG TPA: arginine--tRNA ligase [Bdellovibrionota bacterium]|jgi:arginyl-tRNA synthetase
MIQYLAKASRLISEALGSESGLSQQQVLQLLERPPTEDKGDIAFPCFQVAKALRKAPPLVAKDLSEKLSTQQDPDFEWIRPLGPYLNFRLSASAAFAIVSDVKAQGTRFGHSEAGKGQKVLIEYSSPNVAKELHIGHFRNTILGQALNNIYKAAGFTTISVNHLGDWGSQFGRVAWGYQHYGDEKELEKDPLNYLTKLYVRVNQEEESNPAIDKEARLLFKKIEDKDPELTALWKRFRELSIEGLDKVYDRLGVQFDHYIGESFYIDKVEALVTELKKKNLLTLSEGAQVVMLGDDIPPCLVITGDGTTLYATRDLAAAIYRHGHFKFDRCLYVVGNEQALHFRQVFTVLKMMGHKWAETLEHVNYGLYRFKDGKFSTRKGKVILAEEVLNEARDKAVEIINQKNPDLKEKAEAAEIVGVGAVVFNDLSTDRLKDVEFDWERVLDFEGDTGPYVQYTYARACSILRQAKEKGFEPRTPGKSKVLAESEAALSLMKQFGRLGMAVEGAQRLNKPSIVSNYALDLAKAFNGFYRQVRVLDENAPREETAEKLGLVAAFRQVLGNTLGLLCMRAPEEM